MSALRDLIARMDDLLAREDLTFAECSLAEEWCLAMREARAYLAATASPEVKETVTSTEAVREFTPEQIANLYGGEICDRYLRDKLDDCWDAVLLIVQQAVERDREHTTIVSTGTGIPPADLNRRVEVEERLIDAAKGKKPVPTPEECLALALRLGVPEGVPRGKPTYAELEARAAGLEKERDEAVRAQKKAQAPVFTATATNAEVAILSGVGRWSLKYGGQPVYFNTEREALAFRSAIKQRIESALLTSRAETREARQALRLARCPRPANHRPEDFEVGPCVDTGECGCMFARALNGEGEKN